MEATELFKIRTRGNTPWFCNPEVYVSYYSRDLELVEKITEIFLGKRIAKGSYAIIRKATRIPKRFTTFSRRPRCLSFFELCQPPVGTNQFPMARGCPESYSVVCMDEKPVQFFPISARGSVLKRMVFNTRFTSISVTVLRAFFSLPNPG